MTDSERATARYDIASLLEREGPLTRSEIQVRMHRSLPKPELIGCLSYLTVARLIERRGGRRYATTGLDIPMVASTA